MKTKNENALEKRDASKPNRDEHVYIPLTDIYEKDGAILIRCDMPGVTLDQVDIQLENSELEITGKQTAFQPEDADLLMSECGVGTFRRKFNIPQQIDRDQINARLHNGVLEIELPKAEQAKPRRIEITAGS